MTQGVQLSGFQKCIVHSIVAAGVEGIAQSVWSILFNIKGLNRLLTGVDAPSFGSMFVYGAISGGIGGTIDLVCQFFDQYTLEFRKNHPKPFKVARLAFVYFISVPTSLWGAKRLGCDISWKSISVMTAAQALLHLFMISIELDNKLWKNIQERYSQIV